MSSSAITSASTAVQAITTHATSDATAAKPMVVALICKGKRQKLLTFQVSSCSLLVLHCCTMKLMLAAMKLVLFLKLILATVELLLATVEWMFVAVKVMLAAVEWIVAAVVTGATLTQTLATVATADQST